jgi:nicotinamidase-related amidase
MKKKGFIIVFLLICFNFLTAQDYKTVIDLWTKVKVPQTPEIKAVSVNSENTALLILDLQSRNCNAERRPRCVACLPLVADFIKQARQKNMAVVYAGRREDILPTVAPLKEEPVVRSSVDKFYKTELENILRGQNIETVIVIGTTAEGAVLHTATGASLRGFKVVVPVDGMPASDLYAEQYTAWHLVNAPGTRRNTTLTTIPMIRIE